MYMDSKTILRKIKDNRNYLKEKKVKKIWLFGSYLKGKQKNGSDIDLIVEFKEITFKDYMGLLYLLQKIFNKKVDLVIEKNLKPELNYVKKEAEYVKI